MEIKPVRTAIIGCGAISESYLETMTKKFKILEVAACCDRDERKMHDKAQRYNLKPMTIEELAADPSIELVVNLTTPGAHYTVIKQMLEAGKHVYTEKALTVELEHAAELLKLADEKGLYLGAAPDTFLGSAIQTARYVVESGMIGEVTSCHCALTRDSELFSRAFPFTAKPGGGIGFDVGIYYLTALLSILGPVREVAGVTRTRSPQRMDYTPAHFGETFEIQCENLMAATVQFERGTVGNLLFDANSIFTIPEQPSLVLNGTLGILFMADPNNFGGDVRVMLKGSSEPFILPQSHAFNQEYRGLGVAEMAWSLRRGRRNRANKEMAYHALEVLHGIVRSGEARANQVMQSTFEMTPAIPRGYSGQTYFTFIEEAGIAL